MATKVQEVKMLEEFVAQVKDLGDSYLGSLLNDEVVMWFSAQVSADFSCDLLSYVEAQRAASARVRDLVSEASTLRKMMKEAQEKAEKDLDHVRLAVDGLTDALHQKSEQVKELERRLRDGEADNDALEGLVRERDQEIVALKARLFDEMERTRYFESLPVVLKK